MSRSGHDAHAACIAERERLRTALAGLVFMVIDHGNDCDSCDSALTKAREALRRSKVGVRPTELEAVEPKRKPSKRRARR